MAKNILQATFLMAGGLLMVCALRSQELYVFTEPSSNMPARSISPRITSRLLRDDSRHRLGQRYSPELMLGLNSRWMVHGAASFSNMYSNAMRLESGRIYAKYRFYSADEVHRHFRMAAFGEISVSRNALMYDELSAEGDQSAARGGLIATQLLGRLALSSTVGYTQVLSARPVLAPDRYVYHAYDYALSAGYLVLPVQYKGFGQTNLNVYVELLGQQAADKQRGFTDLAPALQLIFNSNAKLNLGYRFQLVGNMYRMSDNSFLVSFERTFLNALNRSRRTK